jgi:hypothetical protein
MRNQDILSITLKIVGIWFLGYFILSIQELIISTSMFFTEHPVISPITYLCTTIVGMLCDLVIGICLLRYSDIISAKLIKSDKEIHLDIGENWEYRVFSLILKVIGIICLTKGIPQLCSAVANIARTGVYIISDSNLYTAIPYIAIGIYLLLSGKLIINLAFRKREKIADNSHRDT